MLTPKQQTIYDHFQTTDPTMAKLFKDSVEHNNPLLFPSAKPSRTYFKTLVRSIVGQQISTKAAASVFKRLQTETKLSSRKIKESPIDLLQSCGLSRQKAEYIQALATNWKRLKVSEFPNLDDEEIINRLTACRGIGVWTAEMFLMSALARDNVFSVHDLGLRQQISITYGVDREDKKTIKQIAQNWEPYKTSASLTLWHQLDNTPGLL